MNFERITVMENGSRGPRNVNPIPVDKICRERFLGGVTGAANLLQKRLPNCGGHVVKLVIMLPGVTRRRQQILWRPLSIYVQESI